MNGKIEALLRCICRQLFQIEEAEQDKIERNKCKAKISGKTVN